MLDYTRNTGVVEGVKRIIKFIEQQEDVKNNILEQLKDEE